MKWNELFTMKKMGSLVACVLGCLLLVAISNVQAAQRCNLATLSGATVPALPTGKILQSDAGRLMEQEMFPESTVDAGMAVAAPKEPFREHIRFVPTVPDRFRLILVVFMW